MEAARNYTNDMREKAVRSSIKKNMKPISGDQKKFISYNDFDKLIQSLE